ncbi:hypothetical protein VNO78_23421 [Psophocarpus tetragonolobus]|uniref:Uncharacterized protein n=1 Tax=Psophocarpus tetragonolobus TaxID=3891 RepID=A0AAN9S6L7_PSOTE
MWPSKIPWHNSHTLLHYNNKLTFQASLCPCISLNLHQSFHRSLSLSLSLSPSPPGKPVSVARPRFDR